MFGNYSRNDLSFHAYYCRGFPDVVDYWTILKTSLIKNDVVYFSLKEACRRAHANCTEETYRKEVRIVFLDLQHAYLNLLELDLQSRGCSLKTCARTTLYCIEIWSNFAILFSRKMVYLSTLTVYQNF